MTSETAKKWLPIIQAVSEGRVIQKIKTVPGGCSVWVDCDVESVIHWCPDFIRVKPEPPKLREFWITKYHAVLTVHESKGEATGFLFKVNAQFGDHELIHVREVIDE